MNATMKSLLEYLDKKGYDLDEYLYMDIRSISKEGYSKSTHRFDLRRGRTFGKAPKSVYFVILWYDHDHYSTFARANDQWFALAADPLPANDRRLAQELLKRPDLPFPYRVELLNYMKWDRDDMLLHRIFGDGLDANLWANPHGSNKELMRDIAEFYCCWIGC